MGDTLEIILVVVVIMAGATAIQLMSWLATPSPIVVWVHIDGR